MKKTTADNYHSEKFTPKFMGELMRAVCFLLIVVLLVSVIQGIFQAKWNGEGYHAARLKELSKETPDVVFVGSSVCTWGINPLVIYHETGIVTCNFGVTGGSASTTKFLVEEALKTFEPKILAVEPTVMMALSTTEFHSRVGFDPFGFSFEKLEAVKEMIDLNEKYGLNAEYEPLVSYAIPLLRYHSRWKELKDEDFSLPEYYRVLSERMHGYVFHYSGEKTADYSQYNDPVYYDPAQLDEAKRIFAEEVEMCRKKGVEMVLIKALLPWRQGQHDIIASWAEEYGVPFFDSNDVREEIGVDPEHDFLDGVHLNDQGATKVSRAIGAYLRDNFALDDHRGEASYEDWEDDWTFYQQDKAA